MTLMRSILLAALLIASCIPLFTGCRKRAPDYGIEKRLALPTRKKQVWAVAPALNLSGQKEVDPLLQADVLYGQLQHVQGLTVIPVNRVAEVYASLRIEKVQSAEQAAIVCELLGADALIVPTITAYDQYNPPKLGAALQLFGRNVDYFGGGRRPDPRDLARRASPPPDEPLPTGGNFLQSAGMFDAANGSVRTALFRYARGRNDPAGPYQEKEYLVDMDRYSGFVYHELIQDLLLAVPMKRS